MSKREYSCRALAVESLWPDELPGGLADGTEAPTLQAFLPESDAPTAAVVVCPGGGYHIHADHEADPIAEWLAGMGVAGIVLRYRLTPNHHPRPLADAQRAIRTVRARAQQWNIDPQRVGVLGFSAGGHLAASVATLFDVETFTAGDDVDRLSARPDAAVLCYAVILCGKHGHTGSVKNLLGPKENDETARKLLSLDKQVSAQTPPTFLWHTADDDVVDVRNSLSFAAACREHNVPAELHVFPHGRHGLGLAEDEASVRAWPTLCETWLTSIGFRSDGWCATQ